MSTEDEYTRDVARGDGWEMHLGDSCEVLREIDANSIDLSTYSPPFASLFTYSNSLRDMGNSKSRSEFFAHYMFVLTELLRITKPGRISAVHTADLTLTKATHGYMGMYDFPGDVIRAHKKAGWIFYGRAHVDKNPQALRHGQQVLTPEGWTPIEKMTVGDQVIGADGTATDVIGVWPQGRGSIYRITFSDRATVDCDAAHLWTVRGPSSREPGKWKTITTAELAEDGVLMSCGRKRWEIPLVAPVQFAAQAELPLHPYVLGALLGDGNVTQRGSVSITTQRATAARVASFLPSGHTLREQDRTSKGDDTATFHIGHPEWHRNDVLTALRDLDVQGRRSWEKRVPAQYLTASIKDRRELLKGMLDTDGTVKLNGAIVFNSTSEGMARDVMDVVRSLGGMARLRCEMDRPYKYKGEIHQGRPLYAVSIAMNGEPLFTLPSKAARWKSERSQWHREIESIELIGEDDRTCITVAADDGLFVTEGHVVTHNSQAIRTKAHALMFATKNRDSSDTRPAIGDQLLVFKKPGVNAVPIKTDVTNEEWIQWARPIWPALSDEDAVSAMEQEGLIPHPAWFDIRETHTLNHRSARSENDEKHICPLQLDFIERCVRLWSNKGETVLTPFAGVGSEVYMANKLGRRGVGIELKRSYFDTAVKNLTAPDTPAKAA